MTASVEELLAQIDHTLADWETSEDAMRWAPEPPAWPAGPSEAVRVNHWTEMGWLDETHRWDAVDADPMGDLAAAVLPGTTQIRTFSFDVDPQAVAFLNRLLTPPRAPADEQRQRALELRRTRNTGPVARRLDGRRTR